MITMTSTKENTKKNGQFQLTDLLEGDSENLLAEILQLGVPQLMEAERDHHIEAERYERSAQRRTTRNGYKPRQLYTRVGTLDLRVPQTRDGEFYPSILKRYQRSEKALVSADRKSTRLNSSHVAISYSVFCLQKTIANRSHLS